MLKSIIKIIESGLSKNNADSEIGHSLELAAAALMFEVSNADHEILSEERKVIYNNIRREFNLNDVEINELLNMAESEVKNAVSLSDFSTILKENLEYEDRKKIIRCLWKVAFADDSLDKYEEYFIRKISDLLYISHSDYIREKLYVLEENTT